MNTVKAASVSFLAYLSHNLPVSHALSVSCYPAYSSTADYEPGSLVSFESTNFRCTSNAYSIYCNGAAPPSAGHITFGTVAWIRESACSGTPATPVITEASTEIWDNTGCPEDFHPDASYNPNDYVSVDYLVYKCRPEAAGPSGNHCGGIGFEPGTGHYGDVAWELMGSCIGTMSPTSSPPLWENTGCPEEYDTKSSYEPGDLVSSNSLVYVCRYDTAGSSATYCGSVQFEPGYGQYWTLAWTEIGSCTGTLSPTSSPVSSFPL